jgi:hypothetical protein
MRKKSCKNQLKIQRFKEQERTRTYLDQVLPIFIGKYRVAVLILPESALIVLQVVPQLEQSFELLYRNQQCRQARSPVKHVHHDYDVRAVHNYIPKGE